MWLPIRDITVAPNAKLSVSEFVMASTREPRQTSSRQLNAFQP